MSAGKTDILIEQGVDFELKMSVKYSDDSLPDYNNHTARMHIREELGDATVIVDLTTENGKIELVDNNITLTIPNAETTAITITNGVYDLELVDPVGKVIRLLEGKIKVSPEVTR